MKSSESCGSSPVTSTLHLMPKPKLTPSLAFSHSAFCISEDPCSIKGSGLQPLHPSVTPRSLLRGKAYGQGHGHTGGTASLRCDGDVMWQVIRWGTWCVWECVWMCECIHVCQSETESGRDREKEREWGRERERETVRERERERPSSVHVSPTGDKARLCQSREAHRSARDGSHGRMNRTDRHGPVSLSASPTIPMTSPATLSLPMSQVTQIQEASSLTEHALPMTSYSTPGNWQQWHRCVYNTHYFPYITCTNIKITHFHRPAQPKRRPGDAKLLWMSAPTSRPPTSCHS